MDWSFFIVTFLDPFRPILGLLALLLYLYLSLGTAAAYGNKIFMENIFQVIMGWIHPKEMKFVVIKEKEYRR